jgi:hypothetical protein
VAIFIVKIRECDAATTSSGVAVDERTGVVGVVVWGALAGASASEVQVRHCWLPGEAGLGSS